MRRAERCRNARSAFVRSRNFANFLMYSQVPSPPIRPVKATAACLPVEVGREAMVVSSGWEAF